MLIKSIMIVSCASLSISVDAGENKHKKPNYFEYVSTDATQKILIYAMAYEPQTAGRLSCVCTTWNRLVNDNATTQAVIMRNPKFYVENLVTAGYKKLNVPVHHQKEVKDTYEIRETHIYIDVNEKREVWKPRDVALIITSIGTGGGVFAGLIGSYAIKKQGACFTS